MFNGLFAMPPGESVPYGGGTCNPAEPRVGRALIPQWATGSRTLVLFPLEMWCHIKLSDSLYCVLRDSAHPHGKAVHSSESGWGSMQGNLWVFHWEVGRGLGAMLCGPPCPWIRLP